MKPKVSVCICSYNHSRYLGDTLESILAQTYPVHEIVVVDDGSTDESLEIARRYASIYPHIKIYTHEGQANKGVSATANLAFRKATGEYICWLGSDDIWNGNLIESQIGLMVQDETLGLVYARADIIDENGCEQSQLIGEPLPLTENQTATLINRNVIPALTTLFRRCCLEDIGGLDEGIVYSDWELWVRISTCWKIAFTDDVLARYRVHGANMSIGSKISSDLDWSRRLELLNSLKHERPDRSSKVLKERYGPVINLSIEYAWAKMFNAYLDNYYIACQHGKVSDGLKQLGKAIRLQPRRLMGVRCIASLTKYALAGIFKNTMTLSC